MGSDHPTASRRGGPSRLALSAALLAGAVALTAAADGDRPAAPSPPLADAHTALEHAATTVARRAGEISRLDLARELAAARRDGGSPIAHVETRTRVRAAPGGESIERIERRTEFGSASVLPVMGRDRGWLEVIASELPNGATGWVPADHVEVDGVDFELRASIGERTLEVLRDGEVVRRMTVGVGAPATPTPIGTFGVTDKLRIEYDSPYGCCALALSGQQPHVPQGWSGGDRLAVHGTPDPTTIGQAASLGCFRAADHDMRWLIRHVPLGTPARVTP